MDDNWLTLLNSLPKPFRFGEAIAIGIHRDTLRRLKKSGRVEQLSRGLYQVAGTGELMQPDLSLVFRKVPDAVLCLISALYFHGLGTQIPHEIFIAIPRKSNIPRIDYPPTRIFRITEACFSEGIETHRIDNRTIHVYSRPRTVVECFKYRHKIGFDVALEALKEFRKQPDFQLSQILWFARYLRMDRVIRPYLEMLTLTS